MDSDPACHLDHSIANVNPIRISPVSHSITLERITYEQPLNERMRTLLRLEELMQRCRYFSSGDSRWDTHGALLTLHELMETVNRGDLKSDLMKELERQIANLSRLVEQPHIDQDRLTAVMEEQRQAIRHLRGLSGQPDQQLRNNEFFNSIKKRMAIPGGACAFDLPAYHYWLAQAAPVRMAQIEQWQQPFEQIQQAIDLVLRLVRNSVPTMSFVAERGFYQQNLDSDTPFQIIRIGLPTGVPYYPEISAGKHRFSVRFLTFSDLEPRSVQVSEDLTFELACCAL